MLRNKLRFGYFESNINTNQWMRHNVMIEQTISRYFKLDRSRRIYLSTSKDYKDQVSRLLKYFLIFIRRNFEEFMQGKKNLYASGINMKKFILIYRYDMRENKQEVMLTSYRTLIHSYVIFLLYFYFRFVKIIRILKITR